MKVWSGAAGAIVMAGLSQPAAAQDVGQAGQSKATARDGSGTPAAQQDASQTAPSGTTNGVQDIVVTAQRRSENAQRVPIAIAAVSAESLANAHVREISDLTFKAPSLNIVSAQGLVKPFLRGVGTQGATAGIEMPVAIYQDGIYIAAAPAPMFGFGDIQRVEVIKGPQGTLFGRNATGGLISITSRDPHENLEVSASATLANYRTHEADIFVGGGLTNGVRASLYARYGDRKRGFGTNYPTGLGTYTINYDVDLRGKLLLDPASGTAIKLVGDYVDRDSKVNSTTFFGPNSLLNPYRLRSTWDTNSGVEPINHYQGGGGLVDFRQDVGPLQFVSITGYRKSRFAYGVDTDMSPLPVLSSTPIQHDRQFSQELQLQPLSPGSFKWIVGAFYFNSQARLDHFTKYGGPLSPLPTSNATRFVPSKGTTRSFAGYAQADLEVAPGTTLTAGLRYTSETRGFNATTLFVRNNGTTAFSVQSPPDLKYSRLTWRAAINQKVSERARVYASYNRGFKSGGFNPTQPADPAYLPESIDAYEAGFKSDLANGHIRWNGAGFYYDYTNVQVSTFQNGTTGIFNGARAHIYGLETTLTFAPDRHFSITGDASYLHSKFTSFPKGVRGIRNANGSFTQLVGQDLSGNDTPNAPKLTASVSADLNQDTAIGNLAFSANYYYNDGYFSEADNVLRQKAYHVVNLSVKWTSLDEHLYARVWAKNILNQAITTQLNVTPLGAIVGYQAPATVGVTVGLNF